MSISIVIPYELNGNAIELRYALRSAEKHLTGIGDVYLIGDAPDWYTGKHIPFVQTRGNIKWKQRNIYEKVLLACDTPEISDTFLFMNDDHYLLRGYEAGTFPYYCDDMLFTVDQVAYGDYKDTIWNTLMEVNTMCYNFDVHCPILYEKKGVNLLSSLNWERPQGFAIKSAYCFLNKVQKDFSADCKIRHEMEYEELQKAIADRPWFSTSDRCFNHDMKRLMNELYPTPSRYEKTC